ncbi:MAG TPA: hypothetical protein VLY24_18475 [Bryobacteraceae bacterium]|nr:hypothetical protein [Bryobacteraceae bacterium]
MSFEWILNPLTIYAVVAVALLACLALSLGTKLELIRVKRAAQESQKEAAKKIEEMERSMVKLADQAAQSQPGGTIRHSINLTKRAQALRMSRRGETPESITAALAVPKNEVDLLLKVHGMVEAGK